MKPIGMWTVIGNAFVVLWRNLHIAIAIAAVTGGLGALLADFSSEAMVAWLKPANGQPTLVVTQLTLLVVGTLWGSSMGAFAAASALYLWVQRERGKSATFYDTVNFGLNRFPRVFPAHARAFIAVSLGMIVFVPGILFGLQYAFVDAIATLDKEERDPLARSRKLTSSRRGTLFRTFAVFVVWWLPYQLAIVYYLQGRGKGWLFAGGLVDHLVLLLLDLCMVQYYLNLFRKPAAEAAPEIAMKSP